MEFLGLLLAQLEILRPVRFVLFEQLIQVVFLKLEAFEVVGFWACQETVSVLICLHVLLDLQGEALETDANQPQVLVNLALEALEARDLPLGLVNNLHLLLGFALFKQLLVEICDAAHDVLRRVVALHHWIINLRNYNSVTLPTS